MTTNAEAASNTESCYPVWWTPQGYTAPVMDWFEKYAVTGVTTSDPTGGAGTEETDYQYPGDAAWHFDDNEVVKAKYRSYGQWRGYSDVKTLTGAPSDGKQTLSETQYYRGMSKDNNTTAVTLTDSQGGTHEDLDQLSGQPLEAKTWTGNNGTVDHSTITSYWVSAPTATRARSGLPDLTANMVQPAETWTRQALTDGGTTTWRYTETDTTYDPTTTDPDFGLATHVYTHTVPASAAYDRCASTTYAPVNTSLNLAGLTASAETDSAACSGFTEGSPATVPSGLNTLGAPSSVSRPDQVVSATQTFYDDQAFSTTFPQTAAPTTGNVTMTRKASGYSSGAFTWQTATRSQYDTWGRVTGTADGNGHATYTSFTTDSAGLTTAETVTNPLGQKTSQTFDPERGLTLTATDANGVVTTEQSDALGRLTGVWLDSRATSSPANYTYAYTVSKTGVSGTVAQTLHDPGGYTVTATILDALGRTRQTQASSLSNAGRVISDEFYDTRGWVVKKNNRYYDKNSVPVLSLVSVDDGQVPDQDQYTFNGLGQAVQDQSLDGGNPVSATTTVYNGDRTTVIPPQGGEIKSTVTDPLGRTSEIDEYTTAPAVHAPANPFTQPYYLTGGTSAATTYGFDGHGNQAVTRDAGGHSWTSTFNVLGQVTSKQDPDAGTESGMTYDGNSNLLQETNADGQTVSFVYDALNRKTAEYAAATGSQSSSNEVASWVFDNSNNAVPGMTDAVGQLTTETSYSGGAAFVTQQAGFNAFGESLGETVTIPATSQDAGLSGTYSFTHTYTGNLGLPLDDKYGAAGGLPSETVQHTYTNKDLPDGLLGSIYAYATETLYDDYGDVLDEQAGDATASADIISTYDQHTLRLKTQTTGPTGGAQLDQETYAYDLAGNPVSHASTRLGDSSKSETQCYQYDGLDRLTTAWTATDSCAAAPSSSSSATVGDGLGSASAYWTSWSYDVLGNMTSQDQHGLAGGSDTVTTDSYTGTGPHALTGTAVSGGAADSSSFTYDAAGNMKTRTTAADGSQSLTWTADGKLASVTGPAGETDYVYGPDGGLLLQENPGSTTLYLPGEQLTAVTGPDGSTTVTGARIIALPSGGDVVRTGADTAYTFEVPDPQGTNDLQLDHTGKTPTWRQFTPYGAPRGDAVTWDDNRGFLNKPADAATGLTYVGARAYDPATGQFISPDPVLDTSNPQGLNAYLYAGGNPVSGSDPSGEICGNTADGICEGQTQAATDAAGKRMEAYDEAQERYAVSDAVNYTLNQCDTPQCVYRSEYQFVYNPNYLAEQMARYQQIQFDSAIAGLQRAYARQQKAAAAAAQLAKAYQEQALALGAVDAGLLVLDVVQAGLNPVSDGLTVADSVAAGEVISEEEAASAAAGEAEAAESETSQELKAMCGGMSFSPGTRVLLASGKTAPISKLKAGDKVLATNTKTGKTSPEAVTAVLVHHDTDLYNLKVKAHGRVSVIATTSSHLFWDPAARRWVKAASLRNGEPLKTPDGTTAVADGGTTPRQHDGWMWDLTVPGNNDHDFYVLAATQVPTGHGSQDSQLYRGIEAGDVAILVHNSSLDCEIGSDGWPIPTKDNCLECAQKIQDNIGGDIYKLTDRMGAPRLGPSVNDPDGEWFHHYAVIKDRMVYDAFTKSDGMAMEQYMTQWEYGEYLQFTPYEG